VEHHSSPGIGVAAVRGKECPQGFPQQVTSWIRGGEPTQGRGDERRQGRSVVGQQRDRRDVVEPHHPRGVWRRQGKLLDPGRGAGGGARAVQILTGATDRNAQPDAVQFLVELFKVDAADGAQPQPHALLLLAGGRNQHVLDGR
jgi:hypothetical protein